MIEHIRTSKVEAKDGRKRYITTVVRFYSSFDDQLGSPSIRWGHSVATHQYHDPEQGIEIARQRIEKERHSTQKRGLWDKITSRIYHMQFLEENKKIRKAYVEHIHDSFCKNINDFIWKNK